MYVLWVSSLVEKFEQIELFGVKGLCRGQSLE
jgi:hypothetical protein